MLLYRLVTVANPYDARSATELRELHARGAGIAVRDRRPDLPPLFVDVVERARAVAPEARFPSAGALERALTECLGRAQGGTSIVAAPDPFAAGREAPTPAVSLPRQATSFVGRVHEVAACAELLARGRLVTVLGPGGSGKTRLALRVAEQVLPGFAEVRFVDLAPVDAPHVAHAVGAPLGVREGPQRTLADQIAARIGDSRVLAVLDNCEHVRAACGSLVQDLLARCRGLSILATSREMLGVTGELPFHVPPLSLPEATSPPDPVQIHRADSARLFIERARAVRPDFRLSDDVSGAVAEICRRLEGIPLAVELAAARLRLLSVDELRRLLDHRFRLLTESPFSSSPRHRTLSAALGWSYDHLDEAERRLFRRLSAFAGGWILGAAFAVDGGEPDELSLVDVLSRLVDKSLVLVDATVGLHSRFRMLETVREFASDLLQADGEMDATLDRHAAYYLALAEAAEPKLWGREQASWADRLDAEHQNLLAALKWCAGHDRARGLALASLLGRFWVVRAHLTVGRTALDAALGGNPHVGPHPDTARALYGAGVLAAFQADPEGARSKCSGSLEMYRALADRLGVARALVGLGLVAHIAEDYREARRLYAESLELYRELREPRGTAMVLNNLGGIAWREGRWSEARTLHEEALIHAREVGDPDVLGLTLTNLGFIAIQDGSHETARLRLREALALTREVGLRRNGIAVLETAAALLASCFESARAARLYASGEALREALGVPMDAAWRVAHAPLRGRLERDLGALRVTVEQSAGRGLGFEAAVAEAARGLELLEGAVGPGRAPAAARSPRGARG